MNSQLDRYLKNVAACLRTLPHVQRNAELRELELHVVALFDASREHGNTEDKAANAAILRFGSPEKLGRQIARKWWRGRVIEWRNSPGGTFAFGALLFYLPSFILMGLSASHDRGEGMVFVSALSLRFNALWCLGVGLFVGWRMAPRTALAALGIAISAMFAGSVIGQIVFFTPFQPLPRIWMPMDLTQTLGEIENMSFFVLSSSLFIAPGAVVGRAWARRRTISKA